MADISSDISDLWWLRQEKPNSSVPALALGAQIAQRKMDSARQAEQMKVQTSMRMMDLMLERDRNDLAMKSFQVKQTSDLLRAQGMTEIGDYLSKATYNDKLTDRETQAGFWKLTSKYAPFINEQAVNSMWDNTFKAATDRKVKADEHAEELNFEPREVSLPSGERLFELSPGKYQQARGNESIETWVDPTGQAHTRIVRGNTKSGDLTMATQSQVQQRLLGFEKTINMAADLYGKLDPSMLGVRGLMGELAVDRGMAQAFPEMADKERINGRTLLRAFNESIIKSLKVDAQVNRDEEKRLLAALPSPGAVSSLPEAQEKIKTFMGLIKQQAIIDAQQSGKPVPNFALSLDDVAKKVVAKELTEQQAIDLINRYRIGQ